MILIANKDISNSTSLALATYQSLVDSRASFAEKVEEAKRRFSQYNVKGNPTFDDIKRTLVEMCMGPERCHYCEDSKADEVEHIQPKDWFPERCFQWGNYCYVCGPCNGPKNNKFAIFGNESNVPIELVRKKGDPIIEPPLGELVLLNPRTENPLAFLFLDLLNRQYVFTEMHEKGSRDYERANYTIRILGLNSRSYLVKARKNAYNNYKARLTEYIHQKTGSGPKKKLDELIDNLKQEHHQTVWQEMKRQFDFIPELTVLFEQAPEAFGW
jgi:hypothetical protein